MADYGDLAEKLKGLEEAVRSAHQKAGKHGPSLNALFESVKVQIDDEIKKANVELRKRRLALIERIFIPCFEGKLCLTFGTVLLCNVKLDETRGRITSVICGPPHGQEIARKEYLLSREATEPHGFPSSGTQEVIVGYSPEKIAAEIVSGLLVAGIRLTEKRTRRSVPPEESSQAVHSPKMFAELWVSLASLISSYTAMHGLDHESQATVDLEEDMITVSHGEKRLDLRRNGATVNWAREDGTSGTLELTERGRLRGPDGEKELDMAAEAWAQELMQGRLPDQVGETIRTPTR
jgi:hypothetical protein